jgi:hypothetical protein
MWRLPALPIALGKTRRIITPTFLDFVAPVHPRSLVDLTGFERQAGEAIYGVFPKREKKYGSASRIVLHRQQALCFRRIILTIICHIFLSSNTFARQEFWSGVYDD